MEKLRMLEKTLKKSTSELIAFAIDEVFTQNAGKTEGQNAYQLMQQSGFIGCVEIDEILSENYKDYRRTGYVYVRDGVFLPRCNVSRWLRQAQQLRATVKRFGRDKNPVRH